MRFESKNAQIKGFISHSFVNTPLTAAIHHQQWMCYTLLTDPTQTKSNFFYAGDEINSGMYIASYNKIYNRGRGQFALLKMDLTPQVILLVESTYTFALSQ